MADDIMMEEEEEEKIIKRMIKVDYRYNNKTLKGIMDLPGSKLFRIQVRFMRRDANSHAYAVTLSHNHHLPTLFVDVGGNEGDRKKPDVYVYPETDKTLKEYIDDLKAGKIEPIMLYSETRPGNDDKATANFVPQEYRKIVKAILKAVIYLHNNGKCLYFPTQPTHSTSSTASTTEDDSPSLSLEDFGIYGEYLRIWGVSYDSISKSTRARDFHAIHSLISDQIFENSAEIPEDMNNLLTLLKIYARHTSNKRQILIENHYATMSYSERIQFMANLYNKNDGVLIQSPQSQITSYAQALGRLESKTDWKKDIKDGVRKNVLDPVFQCYQESLNRGKYLDIEGFQNQIQVRRDMIRMCRNIATHIRSHMKTSHTDEELDIMLTSCFGKMLVEMARCLLEVDSALFFSFVTWNEQKW